MSIFRGVKWGLGPSPNELCVYPSPGLGGSHPPRYPPPTPPPLQSKPDSPQVQWSSPTPHPHTLASRKVQNAWRQFQHQDPCRGRSTASPAGGWLTRPTTSPKNTVDFLGATKKWWPFKGETKKLLVVISMRKLCFGKTSWKIVLVQMIKSLITNPSLIHH